MIGIAVHRRRFVLVLMYGLVLQSMTAYAPRTLPNSAATTREALPATKPSEAIQLDGPVFGDSGNASSVVFVCDASGSMINKFTMLKLHLGAAIRELKPPQMFDVVFFQDGTASFFSTYKFRKDSMVMATDDNRRDALTFLEEVTTTSTSDALPGLIVGLERKPELLYLLTDGFPMPSTLAARTRELNAAKKIRINTISFVNGADIDELEFEKELETIANQNGGKFRRVREDQIAPPPPARR
jgi:hypothetical protein